MNWNSFHIQSFITPTAYHSISTSSLWYYSKRNLLTSSNSPWIFLEQICIDIENILVIHHLPPIVVGENWSECFRISAMLTLYTHKALLTSFSFHTMSIIYHIMEIEIYQTFCDIMLEYCNVYYLLGFVCAKGSNWRQYENDRIEWHPLCVYLSNYILWSKCWRFILCMLSNVWYPGSLDLNTFMSASMLIWRSSRKWKFWFDGNFGLTMGNGATQFVSELEHILICNCNYVTSEL